jgi:hypothetical protein
MRNRLLVVLSFLLVLAACKKDEYKVYYEGGTAPTLTATTVGSTTLVQANASQPFLKLGWTNPAYRFTTGISSQDVNYVLQIDTVGANFSGPGKQEVSVAKELGTTFTVKDFNTILTKMNLTEDMPHNLEMRVKSTLGNGSLPLYSNVVKATVTPYLDVAVPLPTGGNLWIVGDATKNGWDNPLKAPYDVSQKFTRVSNTLYELVVDLPGGGNYKVLQDNGRWDTQYHMLTGGSWESGEFEKKDSDPGFPGPQSAGTYKITLNFKTGKYTVVKQ